jgi:hypothetical protein
VRLMVVVVPDAAARGEQGILMSWEWGCASLATLREPEDSSTVPDEQYLCYV